MAALLFLYASDLFDHWLQVVSGGLPFVADQILRLASSRWKEWADAHTPWRRRVEISALIIAVVWAGFAAWGDEHKTSQSLQQSISGHGGYIEQISSEKALINGNGGYLDQIAELKRRPAPEPRSESVSTSGKSEPFNTPSGPSKGPLGPIAALEFSQIFGTLPKPCTVRITAPPNSELSQTFNWILTHGGPQADVICSIEHAPSTPNIDDGKGPELSKGGIVVHYDSSFEIGDRIAHWFDADGFKTAVSHQLPKGSSPTLIWLDIGPGTPWKS